MYGVVQLRGGGAPIPGEDARVHHETGCGCVPGNATLGSHTY